MNLPILPPGTILQQMYFKERLKSLKPGTFIEVGCGQGFLSKILLDFGWTGIGYDLNQSSLDKAQKLNQLAINNGLYQIKQEDWLNSVIYRKADLIISSMVLEHLTDFEEKDYFDKCSRFLNSQGKLILFVPAGPEYWGIEDEIAGHYRRYTYSDLERKLLNFGYQIDNLVGLTYPLSNWLYPISELLVSRTEKHKKSMSMLEKTQQSGNRNVWFKTKFTHVLKILLNEFTLYPLYWLQKYNFKQEKALIIYAEATLN